MDCPPSFQNGETCNRDAQCVSNHCAISPGQTSGLCCDRDCHSCGSCNLPGKEGTCVPALAGTDPNHDCIDSASDPSGVCGGKCDGQWACQFPSAGTTCGLCKVCDGAAKCDVMPEDDTACGVIDCDGLDTSCNDYHDLQSKRCATVGTCKSPNTSVACTDVTSLCMPDAGSGAGGSTGSSDAGTDAAGSDAGPPPKSGGGGCGCDVGAGDNGTSFGWLGLTLAGALVVSRRRGRRR
jgi:MYXO-CTERM domain-containing protein